MLLLSASSPSLLLAPPSRRVRGRRNTFAQLLRQDTTQRTSLLPGCPATPTEFCWWTARCPCFCGNAGRRASTDSRHRVKVVLQNNQSISNKHGGGVVRGCTVSVCRRSSVTSWPQRADHRHDERHGRSRKKGRINSPHDCLMLLFISRARGAANAKARNGDNKGNNESEENTPNRI